MVNLAIANLATHGMMPNRDRLFAESLVAIDGSKFKPVNNRDRNFTSAKLKRRMEEIEASINRYLTALDAADREDRTSPDANVMQLRINKYH